MIFTLKEKIFIAVAVLALAGIAFWTAIASEEARKECERVGGRYVKTGSSTIYIKSGNIYIPQHVPTYGCKR